MDVGLHGSLRPPYGLGHLINRHPHHVAKHDCGSLMAVQPLESPVPDGAINHLRVLNPTFDRWNERGSARPRPQVVPSQVEGDRPHPWLDTKTSYAFRVVPLKRLVGPDKGFLSQVLSLLVIAGHPTETPVEPTTHLVDHLWKCCVQVLGEAAGEVIHHRVEPLSCRSGCITPTVPMVRVMDSSTIEAALHTAERSVAAGSGLSGTGFWTVVAEAKRDPALVREHSARIAAIDRAAFEDWALFTLPIRLGTLLMLIATAAGLVLIGAAYFVDGLLAVVLFYAGFAGLLTTTHGLAHLSVGRLFGIGFTHWFIGSIRQPQPGVKVDYATYLGTPAPRRAWMHAAGALVTKLMPFALLGAASAAGLPTWAVWGLAVIGVVTVVTDIVWSTKSSDWMKFRREMGFSQR